MQRWTDDNPENTAGMTYIPLDVDAIEVSDWGPEADGVGLQTEVHVKLTIKDAGSDAPCFLLRFTTPLILDAVINALAVHRGNVWPRRDDAPRA